MEVLIFENEFVFLETAFNYVNDLFFNKAINFSVYTKSQDFKSFEKVNKYDAVIVDISLSVKSDLDGFGILKKLQSINYSSEKIIVMTGNHKIEESLNEKGLSNGYDILTKPIEIIALKEFLLKRKKIN
ncbi:response regulator [Dokdonia sp. PRO95]|uniref:response regulator n=1 Tax=Dokdonia sp. PRO95 TaxID=1239415 RepID=UPI0005513E03|nr:response regulator [Dokdonia sp. PRO95]